MTKLTKKDRHEFYKKLLKITVEDPDINNGVCFYIHRVIFDNYKSNSKIKKLYKEWNQATSYFLIECLPELYNKAPRLWKKDPVGRYWYPVHSRKYWNMRIQHIFDCVNETA
jgi:hypothetical protein